MNDTDAMIRKLLRQQAAIAGFGSFALCQSDLLKILTEAARVCADGLSVPFSKVCRYREAENDLLIEAGHGWHAGVVGNVVSRADETSPQGRAFITGQPSICNDLRRDNDFVLPAFYAQHGGLDAEAQSLSRNPEKKPRLCGASYLWIKREGGFSLMPLRRL
jgi:hypothetical protein